MIIVVDFLKIIDSVDDEVISVRIVRNSDNTVIDISQLTETVAFFLSSTIN